MRRLFRQIDDALIEHLFQPASDLIAYRIGLGRLALACCCLDGACLSSIVSKIASVTGNPGGAAVSAGVLLVVLTALVSLRALFRRMAAKPANPLRATMQPHRAVVLLMLLAGIAQPWTLDLGRIADLVMVACAATALYLGACSEPPSIRRRGSVQSVRAAMRRNSVARTPGSASASQTAG